MWYTGDKKDISDTKFLGYATSKDGISWKRYADQPRIKQFKYQNYYDTWL